MCFVKAYVVNNTTLFFPEKTVVFLNIISVRLQKKKKKRIFYKKSKTMRNSKKNNKDIRQRCLNAFYSVS